MPKGVGYEEKSLPTMPKDEMKRSSTGGRGGMAGKPTMQQQSLPTMPADEMRAASKHSDGIGKQARGMAGGTREHMMAENQPLPPSKREPGTRPG